MISDLQPEYVENLNAMLYEMQASEPKSTPKNKEMIDDNCNALPTKIALMLAKINALF